ncbi:DNA gyrase inhibitor YacG [Cupriavidus sp. BIC8F]|uniref:DNA gyrase inhibitor YacG n=1 Tax=Cupriavidus sp. BIC8F TaxID=3079014 RepID=UPI0029165D49|nr:DNA gyrase inhibitor YacG [Cupriavidus sp. BIC8F]
MPAVVKCPTCGTEVAWVPENKFRPFCSERCKQIDLGAWASEKYVIGGKPGETAADQPEDEDD